MIQTVDNNSIESTLIPILEKGVTVRLYFPLFDFEELHADYSAEVQMHDGIIYYNLAGHGIGNNLKKFSWTSELLLNIIKDNKRFNNGNKFHLKIS